MSNNLGNFIYERTIDYMDARADDNPLRDAYVRYMGSQNFNNNEMGELIDVVLAVADAELDGVRSDREAQGLIKEIIISVVDSHVGAWALSDKRVSDQVPDRMYDDLCRAADQWDDLLNRLRGRSAGSGRGRGGRSVFDDEPRRNVGSSRRTVFGDDNRGRASNGFGQRSRSSVFDDRDDNRDRPTPAAERIQRRSFPDRSEVLRTDRPEAAAQSGPGDRRMSQSSTQRPTRSSPEAAPRYDRSRPEATPQVEKVEGPDMTLERPYDDFWMNGDRWQLAHRSQFVWTWTPQQQTRRSYNPDKEVCFLVKAADGTVREEFLPMTDDLIESAHEIREQTRPFRRRPELSRDLHDPIFESNDLDTVDLDSLISEEDKNRAVLHALKEFMANRRKKLGSTVLVGEEREAVVRVSAEATKTDEHVTCLATLNSILLPGDTRTIEALESVSAVTAEGGDLETLRRRLITLQDDIAENVMSRLDKHFTMEINDALNDQFGLVGLRIDSFIEDFEDLLKCKRFTDMGASYAKQFLQRTRPILSSLTYVTDQEERLDVLEAGDILPLAEDDPDAYTQFRESTVLIFRTASFVHVKLHSDELGLVNEVVRVPPTESADLDQPRLRELYRDLYAAGREMSVGRVYVVTADYLTFELVPISGARDIVGIKKVCF